MVIKIVTLSDTTDRAGVTYPNELYIQLVPYVTYDLSTIYLSTIVDHVSLTHDRLYSIVQPLKERSCNIFFYCKKKCFKIARVYFTRHDTRRVIFFPCNSQTKITRKRVSNKNLTNTIKSQH